MCLLALSSFAELQRLGPQRYSERKERLLANRLYYGISVDAEWDLLSQINWKCREKYNEIETGRLLPDLFY